MVNSKSCNNRLWPPEGDIAKHVVVFCFDVFMNVGYQGFCYFLALFKLFFIKIIDFNEFNEKKNKAKITFI